jgi:large subunit ribosomal protein L2
MKKYNPTSAPRRHMEYIDTRGLTKKAPEKSLTYGRKRDVGRNAFGRITTRHKGGGVKKLYRAVDFLYDKLDMTARVASLEYDPNRSAFIALLIYRDGERRYVLAPQQMKVGASVVSSEKAPIEVGNRTPLSRIPIGTMIYNVELERGRGGVLARSAGVGAIVMAQEGPHTTLQLPSGEIRLIQSQNWASIGSLSNPEHGFMTIGKAGRQRHRGIRPTVRGTAMNPRDHAHGGGEGRTQLGRSAPRTPWGKIARGVKTRRKNARSSVFIIKRRA